MSACDTAARVIRWAGAPTGPPPQGDLRDPLALADPDAALRTALQDLAVIAAARLRLSPPPEAWTLGMETLLMAAAIGAAATPAYASALLDMVPTAAFMGDWITRHALTAPSGPHLPQVIYRQLEGQSPLTALLQYPGPGRQKAALGLGNRLLEYQDGRCLLRDTLATPTGDQATRDWRLELMQRWRMSRPNFVLDIYETAVCFHWPAWREQIAAARQVLTNPAPALGDPALEDALSVARWWQPLAALDQTQPDALSERLYLGYDYRQGIELYWLADRLTRGLP